MNLSYAWLDELVGLGGRPPADIARTLTFHTAGVETVRDVGGGLDGVVTGRVTAVRPHPNADRLRLCTVDTGDGSLREVVCGAPNVAEEQVICFAREGLTLPNGVRLKKAKIRGVESAGMICAEDELGLGEDHAGIIVLAAGTPVGVPVAEVLGARDAIFEIENPDLTHRPDLWGHVGFARELGALLEQPFDPPDAPRADAAFEAAEDDPLSVEIEDPHGCRRYVGVVIEGVSNGVSPWPLRMRLESLGMRSISLLVDVTNLVMLEQGQPIHAFDLRDVQGGVIRVRDARPGETMRTLDGEERRLVPGDLVIADGERAVALAGVMGAENSEVRADTSEILLEAANFDAARVRRTAARLGLRTEASTRFEKSLDPESAMAAARRFTELVLEHCPGARVRRRIADAYPRPVPALRLTLAYDLISRRLGQRVSDAETRANLQALGFRVHEENDGLHVDVPTWRATKDITCAEDLVEEVGRIKGYGGIPLRPPVGNLTPTRASPLRRLERRLGATLSYDLGYAEVKSYAFYGPSDMRRLGLESTPHLHVQDPIAEEQDRLIQTAVASLLRVVQRNVVREPVGRIWESTRLIVPREGAEGLPTEFRILAAATWDREAADDPEGLVFRGLLEDVRALMASAPVGSWTVVDAPGQALAGSLPPPSWLHPGRVGGIRGDDDRLLAIVGEIAPRVLRAYDLEGRIAVAEVLLENVLESLAERGEGYHPIHRYPVVPFDVAVIVPRRTPAADVEAAIRGVDAEAIRDVRLFDVYEGKGIPEDHRSLAFRMELLDPAGTLTTKKAEKLRRRVTTALERLGFTVRAGES